MNFDLDDVHQLIRGWLGSIKDYDPSKEGLHILQYPEPGFRDIYVALAQGPGFNKPRYVGWFAVTEKVNPIHNPMYDFCYELNGLMLYRAKHDNEEK